MNWPSLGLWVSKFHPLVIHFPIALALSAGLAEAVGLVRPTSLGRPVARFCLWLALFGVIAAGVTGWLKVAVGPYAQSTPAEVSQHRWAGTISAAAILLAVVTAEWAARRGGWRVRTAHAFCVVLAVLGVSVAGHLGGALVYGDNFLAYEPVTVASSD